MNQSQYGAEESFLQEEEPKPVLFCCCGDCREPELYEGDDYYQLDGQIICQSCWEEYSSRLRKSVSAQPGYFSQ